MILKKGMRNSEVKGLQQQLTNLGYVTNGVDGIFGEGTKHAVKAFQQDNGLIIDGIAGEKTLTTLARVIKPKPAIEMKTDTPWVDIARKDIGINEHDNEDRVHQMWRDAKLSGLTKFPATEVAWCSGAMSSWMELSGIRSARTDGAKNWLDWGVKLDKPAYGCVAVFTRKGGAHVGLVVGLDKRGSLLILGANQQNAVNIKSFAKSRVSGYRYPEGYAPNYNLGVGDGTELSTNEE